MFPAVVSIEGDSVSMKEKKSMSGEALFFSYIGHHLLTLPHRKDYSLSLKQLSNSLENYTFCCIYARMHRVNIVSVILQRGRSLRNNADLIFSYVEHKSMKMVNGYQIENRAPLRPAE